MSVVVKLYFHEVKIKNAMATSYIRYYTACKQNILPDANRFRLKRNTEMLGVLRVVILNEQTKTKDIMLSRVGLFLEIICLQFKNENPFVSLIVPVEIGTP